MKKHNKIILIAASIAAVSGAVICAAAIGMGGAKTDGLERKTKTISGKITELNIDTAYDDIKIVPRDTDSITLRYTEGKTKKYDIVSENEALTVKYAADKGKKWYERISFNFLNMEQDEAHKIVLEVPHGFEANISVENDYGDAEISDIKGKLNVNLACGDVEIYGCNLSALDCKADYGDIDIKNTKAETVKLNNNCGDIELEETTGNIEAYCDYGDIEFENIAGDNLIFKNNCGDIEGSIRGNEADYAPGAAKRLDADTKVGTVNIWFVR